jgi:hypothetical protein
LRKKTKEWSYNVEAEIKKRKKELSKEYDRLDILSEVRPLTT